VCFRAWRACAKENVITRCFLAPDADPSREKRSTPR
jgi:hypothetical protein